MAKTTFASLYPTLAELVECGMQIDVNVGGYHLKIASLCDESGMICQLFRSRARQRKKLLQKQEELEQLYADSDDMSAFITSYTSRGLP